MNGHDSKSNSGQKATWITSGQQIQIIQIIRIILQMIRILIQIIRIILQMILDLDLFVGSRPGPGLPLTGPGYLGVCSHTHTPGHWGESSGLLVSESEAGAGQRDRTEPVKPVRSALRSAGPKSRPCSIP